MKNNFKVNLGSINFNYEGTPVSLENISFEYEGEGNTQEIAQIGDLYKSLIAVITNSGCCKKEVTEYKTVTNDKGVKALKPVETKKETKSKTDDEIIFDKWNRIVLNSTKNFKQVSIAKLELKNKDENIEIALNNDYVRIIFHKKEESSIFVYIYTDEINTTNINKNVLPQFIDELKIDEEDKNFLKTIIK